jgi:hypothetical protein
MIKNRTILTVTPILIMLLSFSSNGLAQVSDQSKPDAPSRWQLGANNDIVWQVSKDAKLPHKDNLEMSGKMVSSIIKYSINSQKNLEVKKLAFWPSMIIKYDYRSYLKDTSDITPTLQINGKRFNFSEVEKVHFNGMLVFNYKDTEIGITRTIFPSIDKSVVVDRWEISNKTFSIKTIDVKEFIASNSFQGAKQKFTITTTIAGQKVILKKGAHFNIDVLQLATLYGENQQEINVDAELQLRKDMIAKINSNLQLNTPDPILNRAFQFAKIRAAESIFETKMGLVHSPGGGRYYGGVWANDQIEYAGPFFAYLGYDHANVASLNAYKIFMKTMTPDFKPMPSSYEMQGDMTFDGAGDRGDAAMYAWGASSFSLTSGDIEKAKTLWPAIQWSLNYTKGKINKDAVVNSDSDEMEGRIETGTANLSASCLAYGAFSNAAILAKNLGEPQCVIDDYTKVADNLKSAIENYFGADIEGYHTYKYFEEHKKLRHWICLPMVMGINDRKEGTINALLKELWTPNGLLVEKGLDYFWDRATLYALRGIFRGGETEIALAKLKAYSTKRLLSEHVPYAVEAYPEGNQAHLSAESALYCRIYIEGLFGIQPNGFTKFTTIPRLPNGWKEMSLDNINAFNTKFSLRVIPKNDNQVNVSVLNDGKEIFNETKTNGALFDIELSNEK